MIESAVPIPISWDNAKSGDFLLIVSIGKDGDCEPDIDYRYYDTLLVLDSARVSDRSTRRSPCWIC